MNPLFIAWPTVITLAIRVWWGLHVRPKPFPLPGLSKSNLDMIPIPAGLPAPVERFYRTYYGETIPVIDTAVITGRGRIRPFGVWLPARFVFIHQAGCDYRHYFETTFFGFPFLKVNEGYVNNQSFFESPMGTYYDDPNTNQGANLALWAEGAWFPALWLTDAPVHWQAVDDHIAILWVPFGAGEESFVARFNPQTGLVDMLEAMRFKTPKDTKKVLWITSQVQPPGQPAVYYVTWMDIGQPWAALMLEIMEFNLDIGEYINSRGN